MSAYPVGTVASSLEHLRKDHETAMAPLPKSARDLIAATDQAGWRWAASWDKDTGDNPYVSVTVLSPDGEREVRATWHTRKTGTLRQFSCIARTEVRYWHDLTVARARQLVESGPAGTYADAV